MEIVFEGEKQARDVLHDGFLMIMDAPGVAETGFRRSLFGTKHIGP